MHLYFTIVFLLCLRSYCKHLHKMVYLDNRAFLPANHPLRHSEGFPHRVGESHTCTKLKPQSPTYTDVVQRHTLYEAAKNKAQKSFVAKSYGCKAKYAFMRLPAHDRTVQVHPDPMHTITNIITTLVALLAGDINVSQILSEEEEFGRTGWLVDGQYVQGNRNLHNIQ